LLSFDLNPNNPFYPFDVTYTSGSFKVNVTPQGETFANAQVTGVQWFINGVAPSNAIIPTQPNQTLTDITMIDAFESGTTNTVFVRGYLNGSTTQYIQSNSFTVNTLQSDVPVFIITEIDYSNVFTGGFPVKAELAENITVIENNLPNYLTYDPVYSNISGTVPNGATGTFTITLEAENENGTTQETITVNVS